MQQKVQMPGKLNQDLNWDTIMLRCYPDYGFDLIFPGHKLPTNKIPFPLQELILKQMTRSLITINPIHHDKSNCNSNYLPVSQTRTAI